MQLIITVLPHLITKTLRLEQRAKLKLGFATNGLVCFAFLDTAPIPSSSLPSSTLHSAPLLNNQ